MKIPISARINADLLEQLDAWVARQVPPPSRNATIEAAIREFIRGREADNADN